MKTKFGWNEYFAPTPKLFRKIGDSSLIIGTTFTAWAGLTNKPVLVIIGAIFTLLGKLVTNFFSNQININLISN